MPLKVEGDPGYESMVGCPAVSETLPLIAGPHLDIRKPMRRAELRSGAGGPGWKKVRSALVLLFWLGWLAMLAAAVAVIVASPRQEAPSQRWWRREVFFRLRPALLLGVQDTGSCALTRVADRLPYLRSLGVGVLVLEGLFMQDVSPLNLTDTDQNLGTSSQLHQLIADGHQTGVRVILDLCELHIFNRTEFSNETDASVYFQNFLRHWLQQGVSGFEVCVPNQAFSEKTLGDWTELVEAFSTEDSEWIMVVKQTGASSPGLRVLESNSSLVDVLLYQPLVSTPTHPLTAAQLAHITETWLKTPQADWMSLTVDGVTAVNLKRVILVLMMTLPGTPVITYGAEISPTTDEERRWRVLFRSLSRVRTREEALLFGSFTFLPVNGTSLSSAPTNSTATPPLAFLRSWGCVHFLVLLNFGSETVVLDPNWAPSLPEAGVFVTSTGLNHFGPVSLRSIILLPCEAIVIKLFQANSRV
ncbi:4F2 cell-surface antigen heavy chain [Brachyhypopomus gauderio]|uniref:4F2 cell-surface antigen heavy chain n=1 Tax=Brachyhypopomus gauderio TaxID=698409 RepID=UPI0040423850